MENAKPDVPGYFCLEHFEWLGRCSCCGKEFHKTPEWGWWYKSKIVCSYHCMRTLERADPASYLYRKIHGEAKPMRENKPVTPAEFEKVRELYERGVSYRDIAKAVHHPAGSITGIVRKLELQKRNKNMTQAEIDRIRALYQSGLSGYQIAQRLKLSTATVYKYTADISRKKSKGRKAGGLKDGSGERDADQRAKV